MLCEIAGKQPQKLIHVFSRGGMNTIFPSSTPSLGGASNKEMKHVFMLLFQITTQQESETGDIPRFNYLVTYYKTVLRRRAATCTPPGGVLPYMGYIGMCGPKGYGFSAVLVINRVSILAILPPFWS